MRFTIAALAVLPFLVPSSSRACPGHESAQLTFASTAWDDAPKACVAPQAEQQATQTVKTITVADLVRLQKEKKAEVVDVNTSETRTKFGVIPGATLLSSASKYDPAKELPATKDTPLIFYCANTKCQASHVAAERALENGYKDVSVLPDGIMGWKQSGQKTKVPLSS